MLARRFAVAVIALIAVVAVPDARAAGVAAARRQARGAAAESADASMPIARAAVPDRVGPAGFEGPLTFERAYALALLNSQGVRRAQLAVDAARAVLDERTAAFRPSVEASAGIAYIANPPDGITIPTGAFGAVPDPTSTFPALVPDQPLVLVPDPENRGMSVSVEPRQTLYAWGKLNAAHEAAAAGIATELSRSDGVAAELRTRTATAFAGVVAARAALPMVEAMAEVQRERVADTELQYSAGTVTRADLLAERVTLATLDAQLVRSRQGLRTAERALEAIIGAPFADLVARPTDATLSDEGTLVATANANSPRLAELRTIEAQAGIRVRIIDGSRPFLPDLGLSVRADAQGQRIPLVQANWRDTWDANLRISVGAQASLYDGGANAAERRAAVAGREQTASAIIELVDALPLQVRVAVEQYEVARAIRDEAAARLESARESDRNAGVSLENELITRGDRLGARLRLLEAELALLSADAAIERALIEVESIVGTPLR